MSKLTKTFHIDVTSKVDGRRYHGSFTTKKLTMGDLSRMGMLKAQMGGGFNFDPATGQGLDPATNLLNEMMVHCSVALVQKPDLFDPENMSDVEVLREVYEEVASFVANFHVRESEAGGEDSSRGGEDSGSIELEGSRRSADAHQDLVDKKVPQVSQL